MSEYEARLLDAHAEACAAWQTAQEAHVGEVAALLAASERMTQSVDAHLSKLHGQASTLLAHAQSSSARVRAQSREHAEAWAQQQQALRGGAESMRAAMLAAVDAFVQQQVQAMQQHEQAAHDTFRAAKPADTQALCASHRTAWEAAHADLSSVSNELSDACVALHASAQDLAPRADAHDQHFAHEMEAAAAQWRATTGPLWERHSSVEAVAQSAQGAADEVRTTLAALDLRTEASAVLEAATHVQDASGEAAERLQRLQGLLGPLAPMPEATGETPRRRTWSMPVWDVVPSDRTEALAWWEQAADRTPLRERRPVENRPLIATPHK